MSGLGGMPDDTATETQLGGGCRSYNMHMLGLCTPPLKVQCGCWTSQADLVRQVRRLPAPLPACAMHMAIAYTCTRAFNAHICGCTPAPCWCLPHLPQAGSPCAADSRPAAAAALTVKAHRPRAERGSRSAAQPQHVTTVTSLPKRYQPCHCKAVRRGPAAECTKCSSTTRPSTTCTTLRTWLRSGATPCRVSCTRGRSRAPACA